MSPQLQTAENTSPQSPEQKLRCPRCGSSDTKFCYYNNYNLSQPRHFCKGCRRYWTKGGALRNVPVGGGTRQSSKRTKSSPSAPTSTSKRSKPQPALTTPELPKPQSLSLLLQPLDVAGCFSSLLASAGHFNSFLNSFPNCSSNASSSGFGVHGLELQSSSAAMSNDNFLGLHVGSTECWDGAWPDLSAYNPDSSLR